VFYDDICDRWAGALNFVITSVRASQGPNARGNSRQFEFFGPTSSTTRHCMPNFVVLNFAQLFYHSLGPIARNNLNLSGPRREWHTVLFHILLCSTFLSPQLGPYWGLMLAKMHNLKFSGLRPQRHAIACQIFVVLNFAQLFYHSWGALARKNLNVLGRRRQSHTILCHILLCSTLLNFFITSIRALLGPNARKNARQFEFFGPTSSMTRHCMPNFVVLNFFITREGL
jgi:hypothetical protein